MSWFQSPYSKGKKEIKKDKQGSEYISTFIEYFSM